MKYKPFALILLIMITGLFFAACGTAGYRAALEAYNKGEKYLQQNEFDKAIAQFEIAAKEIPVSSEKRRQEAIEAKERLEGQQHERDIKIQQQREQEAAVLSEREAVRAYIDVYSECAGTILINGRDSGFTAENYKITPVIIENAVNNEYTLAVRDSAGKIYTAGNIVNVQKTGRGNAYSINILDLKTPNSGDEFNIIQNVQGGITITGYTGARRNVVIPEAIEGIKVTRIGSRAFEHQPRGNSTPLINVIIPDTVTCIESYAFKGNRLKSIIIPDEVTSIESFAFMGCGLESVVFGGNVSEIGTGALLDNSLVSLTIPGKVQEIANGAFAVNKLQTIAIPETVRTIGDGAFFINEMQSVTIPNSVTKLGVHSFGNNPLYNAAFPRSFLNNRDNVYNEIFSFYVDNKNTENQINYNDYIRGVFAGISNNNSFSATDIQNFESRGSEIEKYQNQTPAILPANVEDIFMERLYDNYPSLLPFYISQNRKPGTYNWTGRIWTYQEL